MTHIPQYLQHMVPETGTIADELLMALVETMEDQNAVLKDIRDEMHRSERSRTAEVREVVAALRAIANRV